MSAVPTLDTATSGIPRDINHGAMIRAGMVRAMPVALGYIPIGFAFAAMGLAFGALPMHIFLMSALVFACSSQIVALQMITQDATIFSIVLTTLVVNLRHILMSSMVAPYLQRYKKRQIAFFSFLLCDEAFALHSSYWTQNNALRSVPKTETFAVSITLYFGWLLGNLLALGTGITPESMQRLGLDYAPVSMLLGIVVLLAQKWTHVVVMISCGAMAVGLRIAGAGSAGIMIAALVGAALGLGVERWTTRKKSL